jgi:tetratricopeptide (TPR) repeat protein
VARGTQHRKRRPRTNAAVAQAPAKRGRPKRPSWEQQLFFGRLRGHAKWVSFVIAAAFIISFVLLGVGSGSTGISDILGNLLNGSSATGASLSSLQQQTASHPKSATAWQNYANKLEQAHQDDNAIAALTQYSKLRPKDQNALLELAGLYLSRATDWNTLYSDSQALSQALSPSPLLSPKTTSPLGKAVAALPADPVASSVTSELGTTTSNDYEKVIGYLSSRLTVYQQLAALSPNDAVTQYSLAQAAQDAGNSKVALAAYAKFLKLAPNDSLAPTARQQIAALKAAAG